MSSRGDPGASIGAIVGTLCMFVLFGVLARCSETKAPPAEYPVTLRVAEARVSTHGKLTVQWSRAGVEPTILAYSTDDGSSWVAWASLPDGQPSGSLELEIGWRHFRFWYFSFQKLSDRLKGPSDESEADLLTTMANRLLVRAQRRTDGAIQSEYLRIDVLPPVFLTAIYAVIGCGALLLLLVKIRWDAALRNDLTLLINFVAFACLFNKVTMFVAFLAYLVCGALIYYRFHIIRRHDGRNSRLAEVCAWVCIAVLVASLLGIVFAMLVWVKGLIFS